jgi:hypothetical protein
MTMMPLNCGYDQGGALATPNDLCSTLGSWLMIFDHFPRRCEQRARAIQKVPFSGLRSGLPDAGEDSAALRGRHPSPV